MGEHQQNGHPECPSESEIELYVLTHIHSSHIDNSIGSHIEVCTKCRTVYEDLCSFYDILLSNLSKSVSNSVLDLMQKAAADNGRGAIFALHRIPSDTAQHRSSYTCKLLFDTEKNSWSDSMMRISQNTFKKSDYILRAFLPSDSKNLLLFLWAKKSEKIKNLRLEFEGLVKVCTTNRCGIAFLAQTALNELDGQIIHTSVRKPSNGYLTTRIRKLGLLLNMCDE